MAVVVLGQPAPAARAPAHVAIFGALAVPAELGPAGGLVAVEADVEAALQCQLRLRSRQHFPVVYSHEPSSDCQDGYFTAEVTVGANPTRVPRVITFALLARNAVSKATVLVSVRMAANR